jgi:HlyD family secretion protein
MTGTRSYNPGRRPRSEDLANRLILGAAGLAAGAVLAAGCGGAITKATIHASGHIEATEVRLAAKVGGRLLELPYREGDAVAAGAVVARFDTSDAEHELARARAELDGADAALRLLLAGTRAEDLRQAEQELARAQAELDAAERDVTRLDALAERGTATVKARDDARTRREVAARATAAARAVLDKLAAGPRAQEIEAARARRAAAEATVAGISQRIADMTVTAPRAGVITGRTAEPGEVLPAGAPLSVLTDIAESWLTVYVDQPSLSRFALGDEVEVRVDGRTEPFAGKVTFVSPVAEFTPKNVQTPDERAKLVFRVKIILDNRDGVFKPGMPADAYFRGSRQPTANSLQHRTTTTPNRDSTIGGRATVVASAAGCQALRSVRAVRPRHADAGTIHAA